LSGNSCTGPCETHLLSLRLLRWVHIYSAVSCVSLVRWVARKFNMVRGDRYMSGEGTRGEQSVGEKQASFTACAKLTYTLFVDWNTEHSVLTLAMSEK